MNVYTHILVATDLSEDSKIVTDRAKMIATASNAKLSIIHVIEFNPMAYGAGEFAVPLNGDIEESIHQHAQQGLISEAARLNIPKENQYLESGITVNHLVETVKKLQVDIDGEALGRRCAVDLAVVGDIKETILALLPLLKKHDNQHLTKAVQHYQKTQKELNELATGTPGRSPIHPQYLAKLISEIADDDAIFTCDVGTVTVWAARYLKMNGKRRLLGSFNHGSMANALSQAIGAQATYKDRQVVAMCGDGGFAMLMGDFITLTQVGLPIKVIIFNNSTLGFVELEMKAAGFLDVGTDLNNPNFADVAKAMGVYSIRVEDPSKIAHALQQAFAHPGPALVDVVTNRMELSMPPKITTEQVKGFSLYVIKAIMNGRGNEVFELAKTNLWR